MPRIKIGGTMQKAPVLPKYLYEEDFPLPPECHPFLVEGETAIKIRITKDTFQRIQSIADVLMNLRGIAKDDSLIHRNHVHVSLLQTLDGALGVKRDERVVIGEVQAKHEDWRSEVESAAHIIGLTTETKLRKGIEPIPYTAEELAGDVDVERAEWEPQRAILPEPNPDLTDAYERRYKVIMDMIVASGDAALFSRFVDRLNYVGMNLLHSIGGIAAANGDADFQAALESLGGRKAGRAESAGGKAGKAS